MRFFKTKNMSENQHITNPSNGEQGVSSVTFAVCLFGIVIVIILIGGYIVIQDWKNANESWRQLETTKQRDGYKNTCDDNYKTATILVETIKQKGLTNNVPPELLFFKTCTQPQSVEKGKD